MNIDSIAEEQNRYVNVTDGALWLRLDAELPEMADLVEFLDARLIDDEQAVTEASDPDRARREVAYKRQILDAYLTSGMYGSLDAPVQLGKWRAHGFDIIDLVEMVYGDHPARPDCPHCKGDG